MGVTYGSTSAAGIAYNELEGSPTGSVDTNGVTAQRIFQVAWANRDSFINELMGIGRSVGGSVVQTAPMQFPGNRPNLIVDSIQWGPFDGSAPSGSTLAALHRATNTHDCCKITATYREKYGGEDGAGGSPTISVPGGTVAYSAQGGVEYATNAATDWYWADGVTKIKEGQGPGIVIPTTHHKIIWSRCIRPPFSAIRETLGKLNSTTFIGAFSGTLLFLTYEVSYEFGAGVQFPGWKLTYTFAERSITSSHFGWNYLFNGDTGDWELPRPVGDAAGRLYESTTFDGLLAFG